MSSLSTPTFFTYNPGHNFSLSATVNVTYADNKTTGPVKISVEGVSTCMNLSNCLPLKPVCSVNDNAITLQRFLNSLLYTNPATTTPNGIALPATSQQLVNDNSNGSSALVISASSPSTPSFYDASFIIALQNLTGFGNTVNEFSWDGTYSTVTNIVTGVLSGISGTTITGSIVIELMLPPAVSPTSIIQLNGIQPDETSIDPSRNFTINALVLNAGSYQYVTLKGSILNGSNPIGNCQTAQAPSGN
jgi:hypothetical protein